MNYLEEIDLIHDWNSTKLEHARNMYAVLHDGEILQTVEMVEANNV